MSDTLIFILFAGGIGFFIFISFYFGERSVILRKLKKIEVKPINRIRENEIAKVIGKISVDNEFLIAPISKRKCVSYKVHVERKVKSGKHSRWSTIIDDKKSIDFIIESRSEKALIEMKNIRSYFNEDEKQESGFLNDANPELEDYLNQYGEKSVGFLGFNKTIRYSEGILEPNESIAILGTANWKDPKDYNIKDSYSKILVLSGNQKDKLIITDDSKATKPKRHA
ncbi:hypothetical protein [Pseudofulvibacter geojedonensis]|uniref:RING-type E3 ubiquitin transferase n=1 Tax=Pseudofulvibacter geojedonensis TaxID=1123758 RepID=A0ABW3I1E1_9FLAO